MRHYIHEIQPLMEYGFTDFMGRTWPDLWVNCYNNLTNDINKSAGIPVYSDSLTQKERDFLLDQRHKNFVMYMEILNNQKEKAA